VQVWTTHSKKQGVQEEGVDQEKKKVRRKRKKKSEKRKIKGATTVGA
jgi:hypothetical protein